MTAAGRLSDSGLSNREVAVQMRLRPVEADRLLWLRRIPPGMIERAMIQPELTPVAAELGRAMEKHGLGAEAVGGLFARWVQDYDETGKVPGQYVLRQQLDTLAKQGAVGEQEGFGGLAGFGGDATLGAFDDERKKAEAYQTSIRSTRQRLTSCQSLADELGVDIKDVHVAAGAVLEELTEKQEKAVRDTIALHRSQTAGEGGQLGQADVAPGPVLEPEAPSSNIEAFPAAPAQQAGLGNDFATNRTSAMAMDVAPGVSAPALGDPEILAAEQERRDILAAGGMDMFGPSGLNEEGSPTDLSEVEERIYNALDAQGQPTDYSTLRKASGSSISVQEREAALRNLIASGRIEHIDEGFTYRRLQQPAEPGTPPASGSDEDLAQGPASSPQAAVIEAAADGEITPAEARDTASEAAQVLSTAEKETPDSPTPKRGYDSGDDIEARVEQLCNEPEEMQKLLDRAQRDEQRSTRERRSTGQPRVSQEAKSAAGRILAQQSNDSPKTSGGPRRVRVSDMDLLQRAVEKCTAGHPAGDVAQRAKDFLASRGGGKSTAAKSKTAAFATARQPVAAPPAPSRSSNRGGKWKPKPTISRRRR